MARLSVEQHLARSGYVQRNTHFAGPDVDGAGGKHGQGGLAAHQSLNNVVDGAIAARRYHHIRVLFDRLARQLTSMAWPLCEPEFSSPAMRAHERECIMQAARLLWHKARYGVGYNHRKIRGLL